MMMDRNEIEKLFRECDRGGKGYLNREDIKVASIRLYGLKMDKYKIERLLSSIPNRIHPGLTLDQFIDFVHSYDHQIDRDDQNRETFLIVDRTCKGFLNKDDFIHAFERMNIRLKLEAIDSAFKQLDVDGDGRVSYRDFDFMMNYLNQTDEKMISSSKNIRYILCILLIIIAITSARRRRKLCDGSKNEVYSSCGNPCKQMTCHDRAQNLTFQPCTDQCIHGCVCLFNHVRPVGPTDRCVLEC